MTLTDLLAIPLLLVGCGLALIAAIGLHRFPDVFTRMHAATKPVVLGVVLVAFGTALRLDATSAKVKLLLVVGFQLLTNPVGSHMIGRAAHRAGEASEFTDPDELAELEHREA